MWSIVEVWTTSEWKLNWRDLFDRVQFVMKTKQDNDVTDCTNAIYVENEIELWWSIRSSMICEKNLIEQWCDQSYRVYAETETELLGPIRPDVVCDEN